MSQSLRMNFLQYLMTEHREELMKATPNNMPADFLQMISQIIITSQIDSFEPNNKNYFKELMNFTNEFNQSKPDTTNVDTLWDSHPTIIQHMFNNYDRSSQFIDNIKSIKQNLNRKKQSSHSTHNKKNSLPKSKTSELQRTTVFHKIRKQQYPMQTNPNVQPQFVHRQTPTQLLNIQDFIEQQQQQQTSRMSQQPSQVPANTIYPQQVMAPSLKPQQINNQYDQYQLQFLNHYSQYGYPMYHQGYQQYPWQHFKQQ